jgi:phosphoglycolate phosphatase-like HAD superfamily hydrolase
MTKKLIIFDFDGVLVDTLLVCHSIDSEMNDIKSLEDYKKLFTGNIFEAKENGKKVVVPNEMFGKMYDERTRELIVPDEMKKLVAILSSNSMLAVVSSTPTSSIQNILSRAGILSLFSNILGSDVHFNKTIKIESLLKEYAISPSNVVFITDTVGDIREGKKCAVSSIAVTWGFHDKQTLENEEPFAVVDTVPELALAIERYFDTI